MGRKVVAMDEKLGAVLAAKLPGVNISALCRDLQISRQTFYKYQGRFVAEGVAGLHERSRRPHCSPGLIDAALEDEIVRLRKTLELDNGAAHIRDHLLRAGVTPLPAVSTIHRALRRRGLVEDQPHKRPRSSWQRFEWPRANDLWQIDGTRWVLATGREAWILDVLDDHSRFVPAARAHRQQTTEAAFDAFTCAVARAGLPCRLLSDNGACFTTRRHGQSVFEANLASLGVQHILSSPFHPQTCGKLERFHQTLKRWLATKPRARSLRELQEQLDEALDFYNHRRPHRALGGATPAERFVAADRAAPADHPLEEAVEIRQLAVDVQGKLRWEPYRIYVGVEAARLPVTVIKSGLSMWIFSADGLLRRLTLNPDRPYQPSGAKRGGPRKIRKVGPCH